MIGVIVISESRAAQEMLNTVQKAMGRKSMHGIEALSVRSIFSKRTLQHRIVLTMRKLSSATGFLILSELYGSTQTNVCLSLQQKGEVEILCGYNLPMLIKAASLNRTTTLPELVKSLTLGGRKHIRCVK